MRRTGVTEGRRLCLGAAVCVLAVVAAGNARPGGQDQAGGTSEAGGHVEYVVRVSRGGAPLSGARVEWRSGPAVTPPLARGTTVGAEPASFRLPAGRYYLVALWRGDGDYARAARPGDLFTYYGANPVELRPGPGGKAALALAEIPSLPEPAGPEGGTGISGLVTLEGRPVPDATVAAYDDPVKARWLESVAEGRTDGEGRFVLSLGPGDYYLLVRKREGGAELGPMLPGDMFGYDPRNPVRVEPGRFSPANVPVIRIAR